MVRNLRSYKGATHVEVAEACNLLINTEYTYRQESDNSDGYTVSVDLLNADKNDKALQQRFKRVYSRRCSQSVCRNLDTAEDYIQNAVTQFTFPKRS